MSSTTHPRPVRLPKPPPQRTAALLQRSLIVVGTLAAVAYLAWRPDELYVVAPVAAVGLWLLIKYPFLGPLGVLVTSMLLRGGLGTGTQTSLHVGFVLVPALAAIWLAHRLYQRSLQLAPSATTLPLIGLAVTAIVSFVAGNLAWNSFAQTAPLRSQLGALGIFLVAVAIFLVVANQIKTMAQLNLIVWTFLAIGAAYMLARATPQFRFLWQYYTEGATGGMFWLWLAVLGAGQALFNNRINPIWRIAAGSLVVLIMAIAMSSAARDWASGWIPPLVALGVLFFLRFPRLALALGVIGAIVALVNFPFIQSFILSPDNEYSLFTRQAAYEIVVTIALSNPLLGIGPANYYWYTPLFPILGYYVSFNSHNQYVDLIAQVGILGILFYTWFFVAAAWTAWKLRSAVAADGHARAYVYACLAGIVGTLVAGWLGDWVLPFVYNVGLTGFRAGILPWLFLGGLVVIEQIYTRKPSNDAALA